MQTEFRIRIADEEDSEKIAAFNQAMAVETEGKRLEDKTIRSGVEEVFGSKDKGFYVVAENKSNEVIGCLMITFEWSDWRNGWFWWIQSVYILPEARGQKIYSGLYDFVKRLAQKRIDVWGFRLYVEKENEHAQRVYEKVGMGATNYLIYEEEL